jgi:hypothetical protein
MESLEVVSSSHEYKHTSQKYNLFKDKLIHCLRMCMHT